jgi:hypothetical protein
VEHHHDHQYPAKEAVARYRKRLSRNRDITEVTESVPFYWSRRDGLSGSRTGRRFFPGRFCCIVGLLQRVETLFPRTAKRGRHGIKLRLGRRARGEEQSPCHRVTAQPRERCESKACIRQECGCLVEAGGAISLSCVDEGVPDPRPQLLVRFPSVLVSLSTSTNAGCCFIRRSSFAFRNFAEMRLGSSASGASSAASAASDCLLARRRAASVARSSARTTPATGVRRVSIASFTLSNAVSTWARSRRFSSEGAVARASAESLSARSARPVPSRNLRLQCRFVSRSAA